VTMVVGKRMNSYLNVSQLKGSRGLANLDVPISVVVLTTI